jgi:hypothetical protein
LEVKDWDVQPTHHASPGKHGIMHRVGAYVAVATVKVYFNDHQVVDVLQVVPNCFLGVFCATAANHQVSAGADADFVGDMAWQEERAVTPLDLDLYAV